MKVLVEFKTDPQLSGRVNRADRIEELERVAKEARDTFAPFLKELRKIDPNLQEGPDTPIMPVMVLTTTDAAIQHLRKKQPAIVKNIKDATGGISVPPGEE